VNQQKAVRKSRSIDLEQLLSQLTVEHRAPLILHSYGLSYEDVASSLGWQRWKVKKRICEGLCIIRDALGIASPKRSRPARNQSRRAEPVASLKLESCPLDKRRLQ
jgi:DNA-directed RNA polymerase specialized sigma24 family protein